MADFFDENWINTFLEFEAEGQPADQTDEEDEDFSMDDDTSETGEENTTEPESVDDAPPADDAPVEDAPDDQEFSMDDDASDTENQEDTTTTDDTSDNQQDQTDDTQDDDNTEDDENFDLPDDDEGSDDTPPADEDSGDEDFSMDGNDGGGDDMSGDDTSDMSNDSSMEDQGTVDTKLKDLESVIFDDLSENEKKMKIKELKELFIYVYKKCDSILDMVTEVKKDEETIQIVEYISNTLIDLKHYVNDYISDVFDYKTYVENLSQLQKYIMIFNAINKVFDQIKRENNE